jgi:hypothetical protein
MCEAKTFVHGTATLYLAPRWSTRRRQSQMMIRTSVAAILAVAMSASGAASQRAEEVRPGARVRVSAPQFFEGHMLSNTMRPAVGTLVSVDSTSVTVRTEEDGTVMTTPFGAIRRFEVSRGTLSRREGSLRGMRKGALVGAGLVAVGYTIAYFVLVVGDELQESNCSFELLECGEQSKAKVPYLVPALAVTTVGGALIGVALGSREREQWDGVRVRALPRTDLQVSVSLRR